jgi:flagellar hook-associated protein 3 FlgL
LIDFKTALEGNDIDRIQGTLDKLENHLATTRMAISESGTNMIRLDLRESVITDLQITYAERKSVLEDADLAEAVMKLKSAETAYQAALASSARVMQVSLVDYIQ